MILENIYSVPVVTFFSVVLIGSYIASALRYRTKMAKLGSSPPMVPYYIPFGWDTLWITIQVQIRLIYALILIVQSTICQHRSRGKEYHPYKVKYIYGTPSFPCICGLFF